MHYFLKFCYIQPNDSGANGLTGWAVVRHPSCWHTTVYIFVRLHL